MMNEQLEKAMQKRDKWQAVIDSLAVDEDGRFLGVPPKDTKYFVAHPTGTFPRWAACRGRVFKEYNEKYGCYATREQAQAAYDKAKPKAPLVDNVGRYLEAPEMDVKYFIQGSPSYWSTLWFNNINDENHLASGVMYNTKENAQKAIDRSKLKQSMRVFMAKEWIDAGEVLDLKSKTQKQFTFELIRGDVCPDWYLGVAMFIALPSKESRDRFRESFTDEQIKLVLEDA